MRRVNSDSTKKKMRTLIEKNEVKDDEIKVLSGNMNNAVSVSVEHFLESSFSCP